LAKREREANEFKVPREGGLRGAERNKRRNGSGPLSQSEEKKEGPGGVRERLKDEERKNPLRSVWC